MKKENKAARICRLILLTFAAVTSCGGIVFFIIKSFAFDTPFSGDAWLGFWGSIIGSVVTILGIALTLSYEKKQSDNTRRLEAQPIITLNALDLDAIHSENESSYHLFVSGGENEDKLHFLFPDIEIQNIGLNFATKIELQFDFNSHNDVALSYGFNPLTILDTKEIKQITLSLDIPKDKIQKYFSSIFIKKENKIFHACYARTLTLLARANKKEYSDKVNKIYYESGKIVTTFEDIYGNIYKQEREATIHLVELSDDEYFAFISLPKFATAKLIG